MCRILPHERNASDVTVYDHRTQIGPPSVLSGQALSNLEAVVAMLSAMVPKSLNLLESDSGRLVLE